MTVVRVVRVVTVVTVVSVVVTVVTKNSVTFSPDFFLQPPESGFYTVRLEQEPSVSPTLGCIFFGFWSPKLDKQWRVLRDCVSLISLTRERESSPSADTFIHKARIWLLSSTRLFFWYETTVTYFLRFSVSRSSLHALWNQTGRSWRSASALSNQLTLFACFALVHD